MQRITHGSLFSGSGGFDLAARMVGMESTWQSEIEPYPIRVLKKNFPDAVQLGDIQRINGAKIEAVDVISGGSPCQDMSVAGKRSGLDGERSTLFHQQIRIVKPMKKNQDSWSGKTSPEHLAAMGGRISETSSKKSSAFQSRAFIFLDLAKKEADGLTLEPSWEMGTRSLGVSWTLNTGESPSEDVESTLSQILEERAHPKYSLSAKACLGILRRAETRGKKLPEILKRALEKQAGAPTGRSQ